MHTGERVKEVTIMEVMKQKAMPQPWRCRTEACSKDKTQLLSTQIMKKQHGCPLTIYTFVCLADSIMLNRTESQWYIYRHERWNLSKI